MCRRIGEERSLSLGETDDWSRSSDSCRECLFCLSSTSIKAKVGKDLIPCLFFQHKYWIKRGRQLLPLLFRAQVLSKKDITKSRRKIYASFVCRTKLSNERWKKIYVSWPVTEWLTRQGNDWTCQKKWRWKIKHFCILSSSKMFLWFLHLCHKAIKSWSAANFSRETKW